MTLSTVTVVSKLLKFDDQVCVNMAWSLVSHLFKYKFRALREARFDLNLLYLTFELASLGIMLDNLTFVFNLLNRAIVKLFKSTLDFDDNVARLSSLWLRQTSKAIRKDTLLRVCTIDSTTLFDEISVLEHNLPITLWVHLQKVTASNFD